MSDPATRLVVVAAVVAVALAVAWVARRRNDRIGAPVDVTGLVDGRAAVVFTKDDCATCLETLALLRALEIPIRQVRAEDEPDRLEERNITGVPVTVIVDEEGREHGRFRGKPPRGALRRAVRRAA